MIVCITWLVLSEELIVRYISSHLDLRLEYRAALPKDIAEDGSDSEI